MTSRCLSPLQKLARNDPALSTRLSEVQSRALLDLSRQVLGVYAERQAVRASRDFFRLLQNVRTQHLDKRAGS